MSIVDPMIAPAVDRARASLAQALRGMVGSGELDLARPPGDPGLIAETSPAWRVHGDFSAMMIGGISALLLQMLHPGALAGVWDHSDFRNDRLGRLRRTAQFIAVTTYGRPPPPSARSRMSARSTTVSTATCRTARATTPTILRC